MVIRILPSMAFVLTWMGIAILASPAFAADEVLLDPGAILRVVAEGRIRCSALKPGAPLRAEFQAPLFVRDRIAIPAGSGLELIMGEVPKQKGPGALRSAVVVLAGGTPSRNTACAASARDAKLALPSGQVTTVDVAMVDMLPQRAVRTKRSRSQLEAKRTIIILQLTRRLAVPKTSGIPAIGDAVTVPSGARARTMLLAAVSASRNRDGDTVQARLLEPVIIDQRIALPEGTVLEARVVRSHPPRWLRRSGSLGLTFEKVVPRAGAPQEILMALSGAETDRGGPHMDSEGTISGGSRSKKRAVLDLGIAYVSGKVADDLLEEGIKYIWTAAASGSAATAARYVGLGVGVVYFFCQRGGDVRLAQYSEVELTLSRPFVLNPDPE